MEQYLQLIFTIVAACFLLLMCYQDWHMRSISWPAFPALGLTLLIIRLNQQSLVEAAPEVLFNWGTLVMIVIALGLYVRLRFRHLRLQQCLGSGDILYWVIAAVYFSPVGFLSYFLASSLVALLIAWALQWHYRTAAKMVSIPLAGIQAACLLAVLGLESLLPAGTAYGASSFFLNGWPQ